MAYTINVAINDNLGGLFLASGVIAPALNASLAGGAPIVNTPSAAATLVFPALPTNPTGTTTLLVDAAPPAVPPITAVPPPSPATITGDLFRSGPITLPAISPALVARNLNVVTLPVSATTTTFATINAGAAGSFSGSFPIPASWLNYLSFAALNPNTGTITGVALSNPGAGLVLTVTGVLTVTQFWFVTVNHNFTLTVPFTAGPSHDATDPNRILSVSLGGATLIATGIPNFVSALIAPNLVSQLTLPNGQNLQQALESSFNSAIQSAVPTGLAPVGLQMTATATISALAFTSSTTGVTPTLVISDLIGTATQPIPPIPTPPPPSPTSLSVSYSPAPQFNSSVFYYFTVKNAASGSPVANAVVSIRNYQTIGVVYQAGKTDAHGKLTASLKLEKITVVIYRNPKNGHEETKLEYPYLSVSAHGYTSYSSELS